MFRSLMRWRFDGGGGGGVRGGVVGIVATAAKAGRSSGLSRMVSTANAAEFCRNLVRENDKEHFFTSLYIPLQSRDAYIAVRAFHVELGSVRNMARGNPQAAAVRLAFWNDQIRNVFRDDVVSEHPVGVALAHAASVRKLTPRWFERAIEARMDTMEEGKPLIPASLEEAEDYCEFVWSSALYSALEACDTSSNSSFRAAHALGRAQGLVALVRSIALETSAGRAIRMPSEGFGQDAATTDVETLTRALCVRATELLDEAQKGLEDIQDSGERRRAFAVMLPATSAKRFVGNLENEGFALKSQSLLQPTAPLRVLWDMTTARVTGKL